MSGNRHSVGFVSMLIVSNCWPRRVDTDPDIISDIQQGQLCFGSSSEIFVVEVFGAHIQNFVGSFLEKLVFGDSDA